MTNSDEIALVQRFYGARGDRAVIDGVMSQDVVWDITPGWPHGTVYRGLDAVLEFLARVGQEFSPVIARPEQFFADGAGHVTVLGHYAATGPSGRSADVRFTHLWTIADGTITRLDQTADTLLLEQLKEKQ
ncbi:nuclear transport factor 2 family protein [Cryptosporangium aurantiacum]|uniref:SnoaL-like domain-containing protein n=1 Tax=Cryptosporangium aurantiacum TaxID=134849 RepID=A0A1M7R3D5_9ACTN|nr:nuclear transport factor 2 family protein [Cryptosporangium aurantiacum]SHN39495.1 hypothetical protein SAMN05443668_106297 [Cryptosporangium aurantiacum]